MLQKFENEARRDPELKDLRTLTNQENGGILFNICLLYTSDAADDQ